MNNHYLVSAAIICLFAKSVVAQTSGSATQRKLPPPNIELQIAGGFALPAGLFGRIHNPGPLLRFSLQQRDTMPRTRARLDFEMFWVTGSGAPYEDLRHFRSVSIVYTALRGLTNSENFKPYVLGHLALQGIDSNGPDADPNGALSVGIGAGLRKKHGRFKFSLELAARTALVTLYGTPNDLRDGLFFPLTFGVTF